LSLELSSGKQAMHPKENEERKCNVKVQYICTETVLSILVRLIRSKTQETNLQPIGRRRDRRDISYHNYRFEIFRAEVLT